jgi:16S rRNA (cytidine1402-2'-O)-methyltransferase
MVAVDDVTEDPAAGQQAARTSGLTSGSAGGSAGGVAGPAGHTGGVLVLAGTPIGDPEDASPRLSRLLREADVIAAEDTRRMRRLAAALGVEPAGRVVSYFEGNEAARTPELVALLRAGQRVVLVTDAGMPSVSDPGYRLVAAAVEAGVTVSAVPGPSAVLTALAVSAMPVDRFCFEGFLPRKAGERAGRLAGLADEPRTLVFFEAPHRVAATLAAMAEAFGADRQAALCRELTKTYEQVRRGSLGQLAEWAAEGVRGEITLVVAGAPPRSTVYAADELAGLVAARERDGEPRKAAIAAVAAATGHRKREVYDAVVAAKHADTGERTAGQPADVPRDGRPRHEAGDEPERRDLT